MGELLVAIALGGMLMLAVGGLEKLPVFRRMLKGRL